MSPCVFVSLEGTLMFSVVAVVAGSLSTTDADVRVSILSHPGRLLCLGGATKDHHVFSRHLQHPAQLSTICSHLDVTLEQCLVTGAENMPGICSDFAGRKAKVFPGIL